MVAIEIGAKNGTLATLISIKCSLSTLPSIFLRKKRNHAQANRWPIKLYWFFFGIFSHGTLLWRTFWSPTVSLDFIDVLLSGLFASSFLYFFFWLWTLLYRLSYFKFSYFIFLSPLEWPSCKLRGRAFITFIYLFLLFMGIFFLRFLS